MKRILAVSAEPHLLDLLDRNLSPYGFAVRAVNTVDRLLEIIGEYQPEVLVLDFILDDINAGAICHQLKMNPRTANLPVILLSEFDDLQRFNDKFGSVAIIKKNELFPTLTEELLHLAAA